MQRIIVVGGGLTGLATALMLAKQGHDVTVLERDPAPAPRTVGEAWDNWDRPGVAQFRQVHFMLPGGRQVLDEHLPEVIGRLTGAGAARFNLMSVLPPAITDRSPRAGDERFLTVTARRPVLEYALASVADDSVDVRRGVRVTGLLSDGRRHVTGVVVQGQAGATEQLAADLVIDAMGQRSPLPGWLDAIGAHRPAEESLDGEIVYYGRFFRAADGAEPPPYRSGLVTRFDSYLLASFPGDNRTWSVACAVSARDQALKVLREEANWNRLLAACPLHAHLITAGEPITGIVSFGGRAERLRGLVTDGTPAATGVLMVGDSWGTTSPIFGRGISLGLIHAALTAEAVAGHPANPVALALEHDRMTRQRLLPWLHNSWQQLSQLTAELAAVAAGRPPAQDTDPGTGIFRDFALAMTQDPDIYRAYVEIGGQLAQPQEVLSRPGLAERIRDLAAGQSVAAPPGPSRAELLAMLA